MYIMKKSKLFAVLIVLLVFIIFSLFFNSIQPFEYNKIKKIHIRHSENDSNSLHFMYKPISMTVIKLAKYLYSGIEIDFKINNMNFDDISPNDLFIWIGVDAPDFDLLKKKNVYTVCYNSEPDTNLYNSNEIWTYSRYQYNNYKKNDTNQIIRFVPIVCEEHVPSVPYNLKNDKLKAIFIGSLHYRQDKRDIINTTTLLKNNLEEKYDLWNDDDFNNYIKNNPNIFINLTKTGTNILPSVRINKLLSHKCIIISEHTNQTDEEYYKGMVYFCKIDEMENVYKKLLNKTGSQLQEESNAIYEKFYNKFYYKNAIKLIVQK